MNPNSKSQLRARYQAVGKWGDVVRVREALKADGVPSDEAWRRADEQFRAELERLEGLQSLDRVTAATARIQGAAPTPPRPDDAAEAAVGVDAALERAKNPPQWTAADFAGQGGRGTPGGRIDFRRDIQWVYETLGRTDVHPREAPNPGAWRLREWASRHPDSFFESILVKMLPRDLTDQEDQRRRDDRRSITIIDDIERAAADAVLPPGPQDDGGEPAVPAESVDAGGE